MASLAEKRIVEFEPSVERDDVSAEQQPQSRPEELRLLEALLFAATEPLDQATLAKRMPDGVDVKAALKQLQADYAGRGVNLVRIANRWTFRTAGDLAWLMTRETTETRKLSRAAIEMLAIIAYHQPITRAEIEDIRGVVTSKGTLDVLLETGWIRPRGRRKTPGRPLTFGTTEAFLSQFSLEALNDLPGLEELKGAGLLDTRLPSGFSVPTPSDDPALREDEEPLEPGDLDLALAPQADPDTAAASETAEAAAATEAGLAETSEPADAVAAGIGESGEIDAVETAAAVGEAAEAMEPAAFAPDHADDNDPVDVETVALAHDEFAPTEAATTNDDDAELVEPVIAELDTAELEAPAEGEPGDYADAEQEPGGRDHGGETA